MSPRLAFTLGALALNSAVVIDNSKFWGGSPFSEPRKAVEVATWTNSRAYFSFEQTIAVPVTTITAADVSSGPVPPWEVTSGQLVS